MSQAFIVAAARAAWAAKAAGGRKGGRLSGWHPVELGAAVLDAVLARSGADPARLNVDGGVMANVTIVENLQGRAR